MIRIYIEGRKIRTVYPHEGREIPLVSYEFFDTKEAESQLQSLIAEGKRRKAQYEVIRGKVEPRYRLKICVAGKKLTITEPLATDEEAFVEEATFTSKADMDKARSLLEEALYVAGVKYKLEGD